MDEAQFWEIIRRVDSTTKGDMDEKCKLIIKEIARLDRPSALAFGELFDAMTDKAYSWELWGAAYAIHGGCSDDTFSDFRVSLISRGIACFEKAIRDPDGLADEEIDDDSWFYEGYQYAVSAGVKAVIGKQVMRKTPGPTEPSGEEWDEDKVNELYPRLSEKFSDRG